MKYFLIIHASPLLNNSLVESGLFATYLSYSLVKNRAIVIGVTLPILKIHKKQHKQKYHKTKQPMNVFFKNKSPGRRKYPVIQHY